MTSRTIRKRKSNSQSKSRRDRTPATKSFLEHLEELRRRMLWSLMVVLLGSLGAYIVSDTIIGVFMEAAGNLVFIKPYEAFLLKLKVALFSGVLVAMPVIFYHIWNFVFEALSSREKRTILLYLPLSLGLFAGGAFFSYQIIVPYSMHFFLSHALPNLSPMISVNAYFSFLIWMVLVFGLVFEMPLVVFFLSQAGIITPDFMRKQRRTIIVGLFVAAALLTPPDIISQIMLVIPLWILLEISIVLASLAKSRKR